MLGPRLLATFDHIPQREEHRAIVDWVGEAGHIRTVPLSGGVRQAHWVRITGAGISRAKLFQRVSKAGMRNPRSQQQA